MIYIIFVIVQPFWKPSFPVDGIIVILELTIPIRIGMFQHRSVISQNNYSFADVKQFFFNLPHIQKIFRLVYMLISFIYRLTLNGLEFFFKNWNITFQEVVMSAPATNPNSQDALHHPTPKMHHKRLHSTSLLLFCPPGRWSNVWVWFSSAFCLNVVLKKKQEVDHMFKWQERSQQINTEFKIGFKAKSCP